MRNGFSLIELLVVLTLMSIVMATVAFRWNEPYLAVKFRSDLERVADFDFRSRRHASSRNRECWLVYDLDANQVEASRWVSTIEGTTEKSIGSKPTLGVVFSSLRTAAGTATNGLVPLRIRSDGSTLTYAIELTQGTKQKWIIFAGRTGQPYFASNIGEIDALFKTLQIQGTDVN